MALPIYDDRSRWADDEWSAQGRDPWEGGGPAPGWENWVAPPPESKGKGQADSKGKASKGGNGGGKGKGRGNRGGGGGKGNGDSRASTTRDYTVILPNNRKSCGFYHWGIRGCTKPQGTCPDDHEKCPFVLPDGSFCLQHHRARDHHMGQR